MGNSQLKTAVKGERWKEVNSILRDSSYSSIVVEQFITACEEFDKLYVGGEILTHCNTEQRNRLLMKTAVKEKRWEEVKTLLVDSNYDNNVVEQFVTVCEDCGVIHVDHKILNHCSMLQRDRLLETSMKRSAWWEVIYLLSYGHYSSSVVDKFITACEKYGKIYVYIEILPHCSTQQLDRLLTVATTKKSWKSVGIVLKAGGSHDKRVWVIEQACLTADYDNFEDHILPYVNNDFLSQCSTQQLDTLLTTATTRGLWRMVNMVLKTGGSHGKHVWVIEQACKTAGWRTVKYYILPHVDSILYHCSTDQLDTLLTTATTWGLWHMVHLLLKVVDSHEKQLWVFNQTWERADCENLYYYILPCLDDDFIFECSTEQLDTLLTTATTAEHVVLASLIMLETGVSVSKRVWVIEKMCKTAVHNNLEECILPYVDGDFLSQCGTQQLDTLLTIATIRGLWDMVHIVFKTGGSHEIRLWVIEHACRTADYRIIYDNILPHVDDNFLSQCTTAQLGTLLTATTTRGLWDIVHTLLTVGGSSETRLWVVEEACRTAENKTIQDCILPHVDLLSQCSTEQLLNTLHTHRFHEEMSERGVSAKLRMWAMSEACKGLTYATVTRIINIAFGISNVQLLINSLPSNRLSREAQSVALRFALRQHRWDVISRASLSQVWEQVRRHLFREAVYQEQWTIVKKWADHTLYDDERWWALEEAYKHKQWDVMLQLADQGLTEIELMRVRYRLAKYADWDVVLLMIRRGVDVTEVREVLESTVISRKTKTTTDRATQQALALRWRQLRQLEENLTRASARRLKLPSTAQQWRTVLFHLHRHPGTFSVLSRSQPSKTVGELLLQRAIEKRAWHVVMHLVTLGLDTDQLDSLLTDMTRRRQWGVCRVLLEQGVSVQSCLSALSVFMEMNQWTLVARVMEFIVDGDFKNQVEQLALNRTVGSLVWQCVSAMCRYGVCVGDTVRLCVMHRAMERREGSVVGECISTMQHYRLSVKQREELFQQAISRGVLQAVKPLMEEKEQTETQHRDAAMLAAIEQRQWDVVDCCQLQGAEVDMKDVHGETPLNREVRKKDMNTVEWKVVEELLVRGADPNVLDKDGFSVLNRAIEAKQWDIVRLLIECLGDIHKSARSNEGYERKRKTPLQLLINERQGEIIHHTLIWCPDQEKGVNDEGETTLHAIALDKRPELLYYQTVRGVNPLTLTERGHSVLFYAVENEHCPQRMVGECTRLGFSTHQPTLTLQTKITNYSWCVTWSLLDKWYHSFTSPFLLAVLRGMPVVAHMLYESGSCSYPELLHLYTMLLDMSDPHTEDGRILLEGEYIDACARRDSFGLYRQRYDAFMNTLTTFLPYLREMASTPRSLVSTCRLVISHCLTVHRRRVRDVQDLDLTDRMKDFLLFSDLTDLDYQ